MYELETKFVHNGAKNDTNERHIIYRGMNWLQFGMHWRLECRELDSVPRITYCDAIKQVAINSDPFTAVTEAEMLFVGFL